MEDKTNIDGNWFPKLIEQFISDDQIEIDGTPEEMTEKAAWKAFGISASLGTLPGPVGMAAIFPELGLLTKVQINLIHKIARYYKKEEKLNSTLILLVFGGIVGVAAGDTVIKKIGPRIIIRILDGKIAQKVAEKIGVKICSRSLAKMAGRWLPLITAPVFGYFSKAMTEQIGKEATLLFAGEIVFEDTLKCRNGHEVSPESVFCPECGVRIATSDEFGAAEAE